MAGLEVSTSINKKHGLLNQIIKQARKIAPVLLSLSGNKIEIPLYRIELCPLLKARLTLNLETPVPGMIITSIMKWYEKNENQEAEDDNVWIVITEEEMEKFLGLTEELAANLGRENGCEPVSILEGLFLEEDDPAVRIALQESFGAVSEKLPKTLEENRIVRQRTKMHKEEMDYQEECFKEQIRLIHEARIEKEENFEKIQQEKREKMKIYMDSPSSAEDRQVRIKKGTTLILSQKKEMENFAEERDKLIKDLDERKAELKSQLHHK